MTSDAAPRLGEIADAAALAELLDRFNREYETPTPGPVVLTGRLRQLLAGDAVLGTLLEISVDGEDADARRFYERHGYRNHEPGRSDPELYYHRYL